MDTSSFQDIEVGQFAERRRTITKDDILRFAEVSGDQNPICVDEEYAKKTVFRRKMAPGLMVASMISAILGTQLPGPGTIYLEQNLEFVAPVRIGDEITARVEVIAKDETSKTVTLKTICLNQRDKLVINGKAVVVVVKK